MELNNLNVCIYTFVAENYGTTLQAFALQRILKNNGVKNDIFKDNPSIGEKIGFLLKNKYKQKLIKEKIILHKANRFSHENDKERSEKFRKFWDENMQFTNSVNNKKDLRYISEKYNVFMCGSDQVWNPTYFKEKNLLGVFPKNKRKLSYATSIGVSTIHKKLEKKYRLFLNEFENISVRENTAKIILSRLIDKNIKVVLDPTLVLEREQWEALLPNYKKENKYILCYFLSENKNYWKLAQNIENLLGIKLKIIPITRESFEKNFDIEYGIGPIEWINLFKNADFILTDSYHGTIFSLIFGKSFYNFKRFSDSELTSQNSRVQDFLTSFNIQDRLIDVSRTVHLNISDLIIDDNKYLQIYKKIETERKKSLNWLLSALKGEKND